MLEWFCCVQSKSLCLVGRSQVKHTWKLKFSMQTHLTHINTIFEYCHASVNSDNLDILHLEDRNVYTSSKK